MRICKNCKKKKVPLELTSRGTKRIYCSTKCYRKFIGKIPKYKVCISCKNKKHVSKFYIIKNSKRPSGACLVCDTKRSTEWQKNNPEKHKNTKLLSKYGLSLNKYNKLLKEQKNRCAICRKNPKGISKRSKLLHVDHDHSTKKIRGLLCHKCNLGIGHLNDDLSIVRNAVRYLKRHNGKETNS